MKILSIALSIALGATALTATATTPDEKKIDALVAKMTLAEKIGQLNQLSASDTYYDDLGGRVRDGQVGSLLNVCDPATVNRLQRDAVEKSRLGIPLVFARDVIHGFRTLFPIPLGQGCSWNPALVREGAAIAADEASSVGIRWTFSPMLDIARDPRWGRIAEGFGEDPLLTGILGKAMIEGYQGTDPSKPYTMAACSKHFAGYGYSESGKDYNTTWLPEGLLRDVVLVPFRMSLEAAPATFMCSFNDINGIPASGNRYLLRDILRDEWGYDGMMVSDWGSIQQMIPHGYSADLRQAAGQAINAGVDMDMEGHAYEAHLKKLVEDGKVDMKTVDEAVRNVLRLKYRLGLFDNPYVDEKNSRRFYAPASLEAATKAVEDCAVLLKNDNALLPLKSGVKVLVTGPMANAHHDQSGTWSFDLEKNRCVTPLEALRSQLGEANVVYAPGLEFSRDRRTDKFAAATEAARDCDVILAFVGEEAVLSGEAHCRTDITLPGAQSALLAELKKTGKPVVAVVMPGRPLVLTADLPNADAMLLSYHGGTMAGPGLANVLTGKACPGGRLNTVLPRANGQSPLYYSRKNTGRPAENITYIDNLELEAGQTSTGCTSFFLDAGDGWLFPFGYGLSYTTFDYATPQLSAPTMSPDGQLTVSCRVTNTGAREASEVVQLYVRDLVGSTVRPVKELKDFAKITLKPGESRDVSFTLPASSLAFTRADGTFGCEPGDFSLWVAPNADAGTPVSFAVK